MNTSIYIPLYQSTDSGTWFRESAPLLYKIVSILFFLGGITIFVGGIVYQNYFFSLDGTIISFSIWEIHRSSKGYPSLKSTLFPRFLQIDEKGITYKTNGFGKENIFLWEDIQEIKEQLTSLKLILNSTEEAIISLSEVNYKELRQAKKVTRELADNNHIPYQ